MIEKMRDWILGVWYDVAIWFMKKRIEGLISVKESMQFELEKVKSERAE